MCAAEPGSPPKGRLGKTILLVLLLGTGACVRYHRQDAIHLSTDPQGAAILADGNDTGYTTPAWLPLSGGESVLVLRRPGFVEERVVVRRGEDVSVIGPKVWITSSSTFSPFPVAVTLEDAVSPFRVDAHPYPRRLHLKLLPR